MLRMPSIAATVDPAWARKLPTAPQDFGAVGDGVTDDTAALQAVFDAGRSLWLPEAEYLVTAPLVKNITANSSLPLVYDFGPGIIKSQVSGDYVVKFTVNGTSHLLENLRVRNLNITGSATEAGGLLIDGGSPASSEYLWLFNVSDSFIGGVSGNSVRIANNAFEGQLINVAAQPPGVADIGILIDIDAGSGGIPSSIDIISCDTHGGLYGLKVGSGFGNVNVLGGTYIQAQNEGVYVSNAFGCTLSHIHVENNWESAASIGAGGAGIHASGSPTIVNCYGTTNQKMKYVVETYTGASDVATLVGGRFSGSVTKYANFTSAAGGKIAWVGGSQTYDTDGNATVSTL